MIAQGRLRLGSAAYVTIFHILSVSNDDPRSFCTILAITGNDVSSAGRMLRELLFTNGDGITLSAGISIAFDENPRLLGQSFHFDKSKARSNDFYSRYKTSQNYSKSVLWKIFLTISKVLIRFACAFQK